MVCLGKVDRAIGLEVEKDATSKLLKWHPVLLAKVPQSREEHEEYQSDTVVESSKAHLYGVVWCGHRDLLS